VQRSFERLLERHGLAGAIRSDNGSPFARVQTLHGLSRLSAWWVALGIDLERGRVGCPQDNGAHERLHRDISLELEGLGEARQEGLDLWRQEFNYERPHEALQMRCPGEVYQNSTRSFAGTPQQLIYPGTAARQVDKNGSLSWQNQKLFLSRSLAGAGRSDLKTPEGSLSKCGLLAYYWVTLIETTLAFCGPISRKKLRMPEDFWRLRPPEKP
jgi:putative transposase